jgi:hypothetical protein
MSPDRDLRRPRGPRRLLRVTALAGVLTTSALAAVTVPSVARAESGTAVVGELVHVMAEGEPGAAHADDAGHRLSWVQTDSGAVRVPADQVATVPAGSTVALTLGAAVEDEVSANGHASARTVLDGEVVASAETTEPTRSPRTGLTNEVTVVLVAPAGTTPDGTRLRDVVATVDGPVADFWSQQTGGAIALGVTDARDWVSTSAGCATPEALWDEVAATVGFVPGPGKHLVLRLSGQTAAQPACSYALAQVGTGPGSGGRLYVRETLTSLIAHELGHNFGLGHSSAVQCEGAVEDGSCRTAGYRDLYDVMGASWSQLGALNAPQASALGVLPAGAQHTVSVGEEATTVALAPLAGNQGIRGLRLIDAEGVAYWLELRSGTGRDGWLGTRDNVYRLDSGVLLHREGTFPDTSFLLDGTPSAAARWDADLQSALPAGVPIRLSDGDLTVTVRSVDGVGAVVDVAPGAPAGEAVAPAPRSTARPGTLAAAPAPAPVPATAPDGAVAEAPVRDLLSPRALEFAITQQPVSLDPAAGTADSLPSFLVPAAGVVLAAGAGLVLRSLSRRRPARP